MNSKPIHLLLADDDEDDCLFFQDALDELSIATTFATVNNGEQLMQFLNKADELPAVLFLDLNMPRKNGFECLVEIRSHERLKKLPVVMYSTSFDTETVDLLYKNGAQFYIRKPAEFAKLKQVIEQALALIMGTGSYQPTKEKFILQP